MQRHCHVRLLHLLQSTTEVVAASLAAHRGNADVTSTESHRFRRSRLGKATDAPSAEWFAWTQQQKCAKAVIGTRREVPRAGMDPTHNQTVFTGRSERDDAKNN